MKHNFKIAAILISMFLLTQFIGLYVVDNYSSVKIVNGEKVEVDSPDLPFGLETPDIKEEKEFSQMFFMIFIAFVFAVFLLLILTKINAEFIIKLWFFLVVVIALGIALNVFVMKVVPSNIEIFSSIFPLSWLLSLIISFPLAFIKIYKRDFLVHNTTELFVYPGIAAIFVPILNIYTISIFLVLISVYDMWAVWHSGIMQKMAKYQIQKLNIFSGFFVPYVSKQVKAKIKKMKKSELKRKKIKVNIAILGGGDVVFPIMASGVMLKTLGLFPAIFVILGAALGLCYLMFFGKKKKFYPAMPFISAGIFAGMLLGYVFNLII
ncbi:hypothetical protein COU59_00255 [Candidatus Pacearchaeota archaeon CG10_big_fil_rev_8_21_14_0_10_34_12]|nr:MAG: hypothetical protein COU59_00255 [Candidatus Pacearchaeota archaeon CG10_big_fil_rev_8_21_14_0_10_34_12]